MIEDIGKVIEELFKPLGVVIRGIVKLVGQVSTILGKLRPREKHNIIIVDEFRQIFPDARQVLEVDANIVRDLDREYSRYGGSFRLIYVTSDATTTRLRNTVGSKVNWYLMWNLDRSSQDKLLQKLNCPLDLEIVWRLLGGNPREVLTLVKYKWNLHL